MAAPSITSLKIGLMANAASRYLIKHDAALAFGHGKSDKHANTFLKENHLLANTNFPRLATPAQTSPPHTPSHPH